MLNMFLHNGIFFENKKINCTDGDVGFVIPVVGYRDLFVVGLNTTLSSLRWKLDKKTYKVTGLTTVDEDKPGNRWNDAKADVNGNLWAGK